MRRLWGKKKKKFRARPSILPDCVFVLREVQRKLASPKPWAAVTNTQTIKKNKLLLWRLRFWEQGISLFGCVFWYHCLSAACGSKIRAFNKDWSNWNTSFFFIFYFPPSTFSPEQDAKLPQRVILKPTGFYCTTNTTINLSTNMCNPQPISHIVTQLFFTLRPQLIQSNQSLLG